MKDKIIKFVITVTIMVIFLAVIVIRAIQVTSLTPKRVFEKSVKSIVELKAVSEDVGESYGTAVCINSDGYLVTNVHVVTYKQMGESIEFDEYQVMF